MHSATVLPLSPAHTSPAHTSSFFCGWFRSRNLLVSHTVHWLSRFNAKGGRGSWTFWANAALPPPPPPISISVFCLYMYVLLTYKNGKMCEVSLIYIFLPISVTKRTMNTKSTQSTKWYCSQKDKSIEVSNLQMDMVHKETMLEKGGKFHKWTMFTKGQSP